MTTRLTARWGWMALAFACGTTDVLPVDDTELDTDDGVARAQDLGLRPLTRAELDHAVQDLLGVELSPSEVLPLPPARGYATDVLAGSVDDALVEGMLVAAESITTALTHAPAAYTVTLEIEDQADLPIAGTILSSGAVISAWAYAEQAYTASIPFEVERTGTWRLSAHAAYFTNDDEPAPAGAPPFLLPIRIDGVPITDLVVASLGTEGPPLTVELELTAGHHVLGYDTTLIDNRVLIFDKVTWVPVTGHAGVLDAAASCPASPPEAEAACVGAALAPVARLAWRRSLDADRQRSLDAFLAAQATLGPSPEELFLVGLRAVLASPEFWFVIEGGEGAQLSDHYQLSPLELATRMSLLVWQSLPDHDLLACAEAGGLGLDDTGACGLIPQLDRLLDDPRSLRVVRGFASAWLLLTRLDVLELDDQAVPEATPALRAALREEAELVLEEVLLGGGSLDALVTADFTWVDRRLAAHYGLPEPSTEGFHRVEVDPTTLGGLVRSGAVLLSTAEPTRVSDVRRGELVLAAFACEPSDPPPAMLPVVEADPGGERLAIATQTQSPGCISCHAALNPWGLSLSEYDITGRYVPEEAIEIPADLYPDAPHSVADVIARLTTDHKAARCFTQHLASWATGRSLAAFEPADLANLSDAAVSDGITFRAALHAVVRSPAFRSRPSVRP